MTKTSIFNSFTPNVYAMSHFQRFEVFPLWDHDFIPDHLHPFLCVHGQVCSIYPRDVALIHLQGIITHIYSQLSPVLDGLMSPLFFKSINGWFYMMKLESWQQFYHNTIPLPVWCLKSPLGDNEDTALWNAACLMMDSYDTSHVVSQSVTHSPPLGASASGRTDSPPGSPTRPRSRPHPPWRCCWRGAWWRPSSEPERRRELHLVPVDRYWTCVSPLERCFPPQLERRSPVDRRRPWHTTCTPAPSLRFRFLGCNSDKPFNVAHYFWLISFARPRLRIHFGVCGLAVNTVELKIDRIHVNKTRM